MSWVIFAFAGAFSWAVVHHLDKLLLYKYSSRYGIGALVIFSSIFPALILPILLAFIGTMPFALSTTKISTLITAGILGAFAALCYFYALEKEETTIVVSMYQLAPVFGYVLGVVFLGEMLTQLQMAGALITILGVTLLSLEFFEDRKMGIRKRTTLFIGVSAFVYALGNVVYKGAAIGDVPYLAAMFWVFVGYVIFGVTTLCIVRDYRNNFISVLRNRHYSVLSFNVLNECFQTAGVMFTAYALLLAPVALVLVMDSYQPILVFVIGMGLTLFAPSLSTERLALFHLLHKCTAISVAVLGTLLMQGA